MALAVGANIASLRQAPGVGEATPRAPSNRGPSADSTFKDQLAALQNPATETLKPSDMNGATAVSTLKFSNHAIDRMQSRGIRFSPEEMTKIENAISKASSKGAKETLLLTDNSALIVSVKDNTVVTVMDKASLKDNVFTKIDSTVVI